MPASAALVRAAVLTDADLCLLDDQLRVEHGPLTDGVGVILRHPLAA